MGPLAGYPDPLLTQEAAKSPKTVSVVHIYIVEARSVLRFRKRQVQRIRWILHAPDSQMLPFASKYAINARIRGWIEPTYLEFEPDAPEELETLT
jgi:hypothetical protein